VDGGGFGVRWWGSRVQEPPGEGLDSTIGVEIRRHGRLLLRSAAARRIAPRAENRFPPPPDDSYIYNGKPLRATYIHVRGHRRLAVVIIRRAYYFTAPPTTTTSDQPCCPIHFPARASQSAVGVCTETINPAEN